MLRIAICDDEANFLQQYSDMLNRWNAMPSNTVYETFDNGDSLLTSHCTTPYDIILLDVVMPMVNGIEIAREIRRNDKKVKIVFLTSSPEFAVESYTVKANNYLVKPIDETILFQCLDEFVSELSRSPETITIRGLYSIHKLVVDDIVYVEAQNKHIIFTLADGTSVETTEPLRIFEEKLILKDCFFKCHRSYIVNLNHINTYTLKEITMLSGQRIPISRNYHKEFESAYFALLFGKAGEVK